VNFLVGDKVRVVNAWLPEEAKQVKAKIVRFQKNQRMDFAVLYWPKSVVVREVGNLFPLDELRK
jgi:hypothetical protein